MDLVLLFTSARDLAIVLATGLAVLFLLRSLQKKSVLRPISGGIPIIGHVLSIAMHGASYIHRCRAKVIWQRKTPQHENMCLNATCKADSVLGSA